MEEIKPEKETKNEVKIDNNPDKPKIMEKMKSNPWMISTILLGIVVIILLIMMFSGGITGNVISIDDAGNKIIEFAESRGANVEIVEVNDIGNLYEIIVSIEGQELPLYITKDGEYLIQGAIPLTMIDDQTNTNTQTQEPPEDSTYTEEDLKKIGIFIDCLAEKGVKIYGANWCGWTKKLVIETIGGFDIAAPIYIECTENQELCSSEEVTGYPTIKIDGEVYGGARTFFGFAEATECITPDVSTVQSTSTQEASCE